MKSILTNYSALLVLIFAGIILGFTSIGKYRLSGDELLTLNIATGLGHSSLIPETGLVNVLPVKKKIFTQNDYWERNTLFNVVQSTATFNGTMVDYNILLYYCIKLTGVNDHLLIGISALFYIISIILVYFLTKNLFIDPKVAIISASLYMLNPFIIHMGHNLRCYSFVTMTTLLASLLILKLERQDSMNIKQKIFWTIVLGLLYGMSFMGQFLALYVFLGHFLYGVYSYFVLRKNILIQIVLGLFICFLFYLVWWMHGGKEGLTNMKIIDKAILHMTSAQTHTSFLSLVMGTVCFINSVIGYYFQFLGYRNSNFFYLLALPIIAIVIALRGISINKKENKNLVFLILMIISSVAFLQLCCIKSGHISSLIWTRFGSFVAPYFMILLGYALCNLLFSKRILLKVISIVIISAHVTLNIMCYQIPFRGYWFTYSDVKGEVVKARSEIIPPNPYPIIAYEIMQHYSKGDTVVYNNYTTSQDVNLYLHDAKYPIFQEINPKQAEEYKIITINN